VLAAPASECGVQLPGVCSCSPGDKGGVSFSCSDAALTSVPKIDVGTKLIKTLNLGKNNLATIKIADFYGLKINRTFL
jgi:hypothetical protein